MATVNGNPEYIEAEPLLGLDEHDLETDAIPPQQPRPKPLSQPLRWLNISTNIQAQNPSTIILLLSLLTFAIVTSGMMYMIPMFRLIEDAFCHLYYDKDPSELIEEHMCKVDGVQKELAYLGGISVMINSLVGVVAALPYGVLADRIGRKPTFTLAYVGIVIGFGWGPSLLLFGVIPNMYLVVLGCLFFLIGGGVPVAMNTLNAMASDVSTESDRATGFLYLSFGAVSGTLVGPFLAGILMQAFSPWCPIALVFALTPCIFGALLFLPETLPAKLKEAAQQQHQPISKKVQEAMREFRVSLSLLKNRRLLGSLVLFIIGPAIFAAYSTTLAQHVSKYFGWTLAETSYLLTPPLGVLHLAVLVALPRVGKLMTEPSGKSGVSIFTKDLLLTRLSLVLMMAGAVIQGLSHNIVLFLLGLAVHTLGSGSSPLGRAISTAYVDPQHTSRLYAVISMLETGGALIGGPVLAWCFHIGMNKSGFWVGLPWFYVAGLVSVALGAMMFVTKPRPRLGMPEESDEEQQRGL
ncbi:major facilitator superfamily domain-containing protein [Triangularia verruculosa]|uniref:Major facilitator superfamily domain-containing protein n=1 Tax=Triangularia verruculosa TaxID=2587418 RepID=A0AAN6XAP2_9PEZI|nr:major facilitator superfamily domain-containing protein [Triangularia verruculosa]